MDPIYKKPGDDPEVTVRVCATPAGPCVESRSTNVGKAVAGALLATGIATGIYFIASALADNDEDVPRRVLPRSRRSRRY